MIRSVGTATVVAFLVLSGCTNLDTRPGYLRSAQNEALPGVEYALPMLQYQVDFSYSIDGCPDAGPVNLTVKAAATPNYVPGESYTVNYAALAGVMKTSDFTIQTAEGTNLLQSINASADDKTADVIKSTVELGLKVASIASPVPIPAFTTPESTSSRGVEAAKTVLEKHRLKRQRLVCSAEAKSQLAALKTAKEKVEESTKALEANTKEVDQIATRAKLRLATKKDRTRLAALHDAQFGLNQTLEGWKEKMEKAQKALAFRDSRHWPDSPSRVQGEIGAGEHLARWAEKMFGLEPAAILDVAAIDKARGASAMTSLRLSDAETKAFNQAVQAELSDQQALLGSACRPGESLGDCAARAERQLCSPTETAVECARKHVAIVAELAPAAGGNPRPCADGVPADLQATCLVASNTTIQARSNVEHKGIFVRPPVRARLTLCRLVDGCAGTKEGPLYRSSWDTAPQLGQLRFLPLVNKMFQSNALSLTLRKDGSIEKFQYSDKASIAAAAAASLAAAAGSVDKHLEERRKQERERLLEARADAAYAREQVLLERADIKYEREEAAALRGEAAALRGEIAAARAEELAAIQFEIDRLTKQKALVAAQAPEAAPAVAQSFINETAWLDAQLAQLRSRLALLKAEKELKEASSES